MSDARDHALLHAAARLAVRGHGRAEPNPLVGCVITDRAGAVVGAGWHQRCGGAHAEVNALAKAGARARGGTAYVTLEPCAHHGRTGPCTVALRDAGIARVVYAHADPHPDASGGADALREMGIDAQRVPEALSRIVTAPFIKRVRSGLPFVTAKWAQTLDGRLATRTGASQWISAPRSRRAVHRERGRVDAILTGIGTVRADDPMLTARDVRRRRVAQRVVIDPRLEVAPTSALVSSARDVPVVIYAAAEACAGVHADALRAAGVTLRAVADDGGELDLRDVLASLATEDDATHVLVEAGAGVLSRLFRAELVDRIWAFIAPVVLGDDAALPIARGAAPAVISDGWRLRTRSVHRRGDDVMLIGDVDRARTR